MKLFIFIDKNSKGLFGDDGAVFATHPTKKTVDSSYEKEIYHRAKTLVRAGTHNLSNALVSALEDEGFEVLEVGGLLHHSAAQLGAGETARLPL